MTTPDTLDLTDRYPLADLLRAWDTAAQRVFQISGADLPLAASILANLSLHTRRPLLVITPDPDDARTLCSDLALFLPQPDPDADHPTALFPEYDVGPLHHASPDRKVSMHRLATLHRLTTSPPALLVTSARALVRKTLPPDALRTHTHTLTIGQLADNASLRAKLTLCGFSEVPIVQDPGTFALHGDIADIFPAHEPHPLRIERWGDEISDIRQFHPQTQRTLSLRRDCSFFPVRQEILDHAALSVAHTRLHARGGELKLPTSRVHTALSDLKAGLHFVGIDALLPGLYPELATLLDYLPTDALVAVVDPDACLHAVRDLWTRRTRDVEEAVRQGDLHFSIPDYYLDADQLASWLAQRDRIDFVRIAIDPDPEDPLPRAPVDQRFAFRARTNADVIAIRKASQGIEQTIQALAPLIQEWRDLYGRIIFACRNATQAERLTALLNTFIGDALLLPGPVEVSEPAPPPAETIEVYHAPLSAGFRSQLLGVALVSGAEVFGQRTATRPDSQKFNEQAAITHFRDLNPGDLVVHIDFGIGRYVGLVHLTVDGVANDFIQLTYQGGDNLYVPVYRLARVQKYIGGDDLKLDKLGSPSWERTKERVKENIRAIAGELLALYAKREMAKGFAFSPPDDLYREFEARFPYDETPDQARAIEETLADMMRPRPMDRLVCGDVGFGKTEVAIRAAMKAVLDNKQVAVLVPTTILAEQHLISFQKRMADLGVRIECLSRFRSTKETKAILAATAEGKVDVLIGTHRLLSKELKFRDLGLLIVDEEQRFGVTHKEKIKQLRHNIDVLTLSATPIPRTLEMSLLGIRDLSIIATPPANRLSVHTHVAKYGDAIIREAITRELARGGQVFFVHNHVATIGEMGEHLAKLIPEARIGIAHGQMPENELEDVMIRYIKNEIDVLLASSIIESGLDIPNANTIIVNRADMFGLSQLYQLRGRVGRGQERAYAYLLVPNKEKLPADAEKRLDVIQTHTDLGSGFHVASYDLEIRGSGSLLGEDQTGHVMSVGLDLYNELLEEAIHDMRGEQVEEDFEPEVNIAIESYIPEDYIAATALRLMFYKRFSLVRSQDELAELYGELMDRFGQAPEPVRNLREIIAIKVALRQIRARRLDAGPSAISVLLDATTRLHPPEVLRIVRESRGWIELTPDMKLLKRLKPEESANPVRAAQQLLDMLIATLPAA
jgi:transcription-repair coupling factor (superfamily II helicase)